MSQHTQPDVQAGSADAIASPCSGGQSCQCGPECRCGDACVCTPDANCVD